MITIQFNRMQKSSFDILLNFCFCVLPKKSKLNGYETWRLAFFEWTIPVV